MQRTEGAGPPEKTDGAPGRTRPAPRRRPFLGFLYTFLTCLSYSLAAVLVKKLPYISPGELTLVRNVGIFAGALPLATYCTRDLLGERKWRWLLLVRALLGGLALLCATTAVARLPLAESTTIMSSFPVVTAVLARLFLREECGPSQGALLALTVCGVLLAVRLPALLGRRGAVALDPGNALGLAAALGSVLFQSAVFVIVRRVRHVHFSVPMLYFGAVGAAVSAFASWGAGVEFVAPRCGRDRAMVLLVGVLGCVGNLLNTVSVQVEGAGIVAALRTMQIVMALVFQTVFFDSAPDAYGVGGAALVVLSLSLMGLRKWMLTLPDESRLRRRFKYLLS